MQTSPGFRPSRHGIGEVSRDGKMRLADSRDGREILLRDGGIKRARCQPVQRTFGREMAGLVINAIGVASVQMVIKDVIEAINEGVHGRDEIGASSHDPGEFLREIVPAQRRLCGYLFDCLAPPLEADFSQHCFSGLKRAAQFLMQQIDRDKLLASRAWRIAGCQPPILIRPLQAGVEIVSACKICRIGRIAHVQIRIQGPISGSAQIEQRGYFHGFHASRTAIRA